ncbi:origin recognition complex subunit 6-like [Portunus trituberculatus]|uniref:origin recognition complex subunit 6-like n=1 Tax=Portunus trituberculatus TaxID=210409 RepID=UPI001E1CED4E|nr:origin recognition complex subunit 6-like [Portunus trituberculatus]XP_045139190.1 origin recognition complex subunit 6-like [Portunus trituberculatus]
MNVGVLQSLAQKLGVTAPATHRKAEELVRLLEVQGGSQLALSTSAKTVICLDLAGSATGTTFDKKLAVKLAGLTHPQYVALSQIAALRLNLSPKVTVTDLCQAHSVTAASQLAQQVLALYEEQKCIKEVDLSLPAYPTAAVYAACSILKIKVDKQRLYESSRSKRKVYQKLVEVMMTLAKSLHSQQASKSGSGKRSRTLVELVEENLSHSSEKRKRTDNKEEEVSAGDDFEDWKKKILAASTTQQ